MYNYDNFLDIKKITKTTDFDVIVSSWGFISSRTLEKEHKLQDFYHTVQDFLQGYTYPQRPKITELNSDQYRLEMYRDDSGLGGDILPISYLNYIPLTAKFWQIQGTGGFMGSIVNEGKTVNVTSNGVGTGFVFFRNEDDFPHQQLRYSNLSFLNDFRLELQGELDGIKLLVTSQDSASELDLVDYKVSDNLYSINLDSIPNIDVVALVIPEGVTSLQFDVSPIGNATMRVPALLLREEFMEGSICLNTALRFTPARFYEYLKSLGFRNNLNIRLNANHYEESDSGSKLQDFAYTWLRSFLTTNRTRKISLSNNLSAGPGFEPYLQKVFGGNNAFTEGFSYLTPASNITLTVLLNRSFACLDLQQTCNAWLEVGYYGLHYVTVDNNQLAIYDDNLVTKFREETGYPAPDYGTIFRTDLVEIPYGDYTRYCNTKLGQFMRELLQSTVSALLDVYEFTGNPFVNVDYDLAEYLFDKDTIIPRYNYSPEYMQFSTGNVLVLNVSSPYENVDATELVDTTTATLLYPDRNIKLSLAPKDVPLTDSLMLGNLKKVQPYNFIRGIPVVVSDIEAFWNASLFMQNLNGFFINGVYVNAS